MIENLPLEWQKSVLSCMATAQTLSWNDLQHGYIQLVTKYIPGPLSLSYFVPFVLLPVALMIPPSVLSHTQLSWYFLPPICAAVVHAWYVMGGVDVVSVDGLLWSTLLIGFKDARKDFRRVILVHNHDHDHASHRGSDFAKDVSRKRTKDEDKRALDGKFADGSQGLRLADPPKGRRNFSGYLQTDEEDILEQPYPANLFPRLKWVLTLIVSTRFHGWLTGAAARDIRQLEIIRRTPNRTRYVLSILPVTIFTQCLVLPLVFQLAIHDPGIPALSPTVQNTSRWLLFSKSKSFVPPPQTVSLLHDFVPAFVLRPLTLGLFTFCMLYGGYYQLVPLVVFTNYLFGLPPDNWSMQNLPDHFGPITSVLDHGVGGLWGRWWHQHMREMVSGPGLVVADHLGLSEQKLAEEEDTVRRERLYNCRYTLQVVSGFFFSGITHMGLVPPFAPGAMGLRLRIAGFFWVQACAVILERLIGSALGLAKVDPYKPRSRTVKAIVSSWTLRALRLVWVLAWLSLTLPLLEQPFERLGWWKIYPPPGCTSSMWYYMRGDWIP
ncbi:MAG: hypothetical protein Q9162_004969 [Coniocarpon cinnabarinum]